MYVCVGVLCECVLYICACVLCPYNYVVCVCVRERERESVVCTSEFADMQMHDMYMYIFRYSLRICFVHLMSYQLLCDLRTCIIISPPSSSPYHSHQVKVLVSQFMRTQMMR